MHTALSRQAAHQVLKTLTRNSIRLGLIAGGLQQIARISAAHLQEVVGGVG